MSTASNAFGVVQIAATIAGAAHGAPANTSAYYAAKAANNSSQSIQSGNAKATGTSSSK